jgi:hypothetical protein
VLLKEIIYNKNIEEYQGEHKPASKENGAPMHDLTLNGIYPKDVYEHPEWYETNPEVKRLIMFARNKPNKKIKIYRAIPFEESIEKRINDLNYQRRVFLKTGRFYKKEKKYLKNKEYYDWLSKEINDLYEKLTNQNKNDDEAMAAKINVGDWVAITKSYALEHGRSHLNGKFKIISKTVQIKELFTDGNSLEEWGYWPNV